MIRRWYDPRLYGRYASLLSRASGLAPLGAALAAAAAALYFRGLSRLALIAGLLAAPVLAAPYWVAGLINFVQASGIDEELPVLMAALIPFASSSYDLATLLATLPERLNLRFLRNESYRLRAYLNTGLDERRALRELARTTPSRSLRDVIRELLTAEELGTSRHRMAMVLYERAMSYIKSSWSRYAKAAEALTEGLVTLLVSIVVLLPMFSLSGPQVMAASMALFLLLSTSSTVALALMRPRLGDVEGGAGVLALVLAAAAASAALLFYGRAVVAVALLAAASVVTEVLWRRAAASLAAAERGLREAAERARLGLGFADELASLGSVGKGVVGAVIYAGGLVGVSKAGRALEALAEVVSESINTMRSLAQESAMLAALSAASPVISIVTLRALAGYVAKYPLAAMIFPLGAVSMSVRLALAMAPLVVLPAAALSRGKRPSAAYSLAAVLASLAALRI